MKKLEVHMPFDFGGKNFFMVKGTIVDLQHILKELNRAKNGQCNSILLNNVSHEIDVISIKLCYLPINTATKRHLHLAYSIYSAIIFSY